MEEGCHVKTFQRVQPRLVVAGLQGRKKSLISAIETTKNMKRTNADAGRGAASGPASARVTNTMRLFYAFPQRRRKKKKEEGNKNVFLSSSFLFFRPTAIAVIAFHPSQLAKPGPGRDGSFPPQDCCLSPSLPPSLMASCLTYSVTSFDNFYLLHSSVLIESSSTRRGGTGFLHANA